MITEDTSTYARVRALLADGEWHTEDELREVAYFPRKWIEELEESGERVTTAENGGLRLRLESPKGRVPGHLPLDAVNVPLGPERGFSAR